MMASAFPLLLVLVFIVLSASAAPIVENEHRMWKKKWPECNRNHYIDIVRPEYPLQDEHLHEKTTGSGRVVYYRCKTCTGCLSGVKEASPCSEFKDTVCSDPPQCAITGCRFMSGLGCELNVSDVTGKSPEELMGPCDPTKVQTKDQPTPAAIPAEVSETGKPATQTVPPKTDPTSTPAGNGKGDLLGSKVYWRIGGPVAAGLFVFVLFVAVVWRCRSQKTQKSENREGETVGMMGEDGPRAPENGAEESGV